MQRRRIIAISASAIYIILSIASFTFHWSRISYDKFSAMFVGILTMPWSFAFALFKDVIIAGAFGYEIGTLGINIMLITFTLLNTGLIYFLIIKVKR